MEFLKSTLKSLVTVKALIAALLIIVLVLRPFAMYTAVKDSEDKDAQTVSNMYIAIGVMSLLAVAIIMFVMKKGIAKDGYLKYMPHVVLFLIVLSMILQISNLAMFNKAEASELTFNATLDMLATVFVTVVMVSYVLNSEDAGAAPDVAAAATAANAFGHFYY
jgi:hypothetical protein